MKTRLRRQRRRLGELTVASARRLTDFALGQRGHVTGHAGLNVGEHVLATGGAQGGEVGLGKALVLAAQGIGEGDVLDQALLHGGAGGGGLIRVRVQRIDDRHRDVIEWLSAPGSQVEDAGLLRMVEKPEVHRHHIVDEHEIALLFARPVAAVLAEQFHPAFGAELVELVERHAGHAALVLLARSVDVEVAETRHLALDAFEILAAFAAHALVEQQLAVAVYVERMLELRALAEGLGAAIGCRGRGIQQARAALVAGLEQAARERVIVVHHVLAVGFHGVAAGPVVEHRLDLAEETFREEVVEQVQVDVVGDPQVGQVAELVALRQVVHGDDVVDAALVQPLDDVAADKPCRSRHNETRHENNSSYDTVAVPNLPTTMPPALFANGIASRGPRPAATRAASVAITVSPAPVTSETSRACA